MSATAPPYRCPPAPPRVRPASGPPADVASFVLRRIDLRLRRTDGRIRHAIWPRRRACLRLVQRVVRVRSAVCADVTALSAVCLSDTAFVYDVFADSTATRRSRVPRAARSQRQERLLSAEHRRRERPAERDAGVRAIRRLRAVQGPLRRSDRRAAFVCDLLAAESVLRLVDR